MAEPVARAALLLIIAEGLLAVMAAMIKHVAGEGLAPEIIVFCRNAIGLALLVPIMMFSGGLGQVRTRRPGLHLLRASSGVAAMFCFFYTIAHVPLAEAVLVKMTAPFFLPLTAWLWLREGIPARTVVAIIIGFTGVAVILQPGTEAFNPVLLVALLSAALMGIAKVSIRKMADTEPPRRVVFWFGFYSTLISAVPLAWHSLAPALALWPWLLAIGATATLAQFAMTSAYQMASPGRIGIYNYTSVIWAASLGFVFWHEVLGWTTLLGTLLIAGAGIWNLQRGRGSAATQ